MKSEGNLATFEEFEEFCKTHFPEQSEDVIKRTWVTLQELPTGTKIRLPRIKGGAVCFEIC